MSWKHVDLSSALLAAARWIMHDAKQRKNKFSDILNIIDINQCSASTLKHFIAQYGSQLITTLDISQKFTSAALNDVPHTEEPSQGEGYDVIVLGGFDERGYNRDSWKLNLITGKFVAKASFPNELLSFGPAMCNTSKGAWFAGGVSKYSLKGTLTAASSQCVLYLKAENMWAILPTLPSPGQGARAVCVGGCQIFFIGGYGGRKTKMDYFNMTTMTWRTCPDLLQGVLAPVVGCMSERIYVVCLPHLENESPSRGYSLQCFDTITSSWSFKASTPEGATINAACRAVTVDHRMFVLGGSEKFCLSYDTLSDTWPTLTPSHRVHSCGAAVYLKGKISFCGGYNGIENERSDVIESYDPTIDTWEVLPVNFPKSLVKHCIIPA